MTGRCSQIVGEPLLPVGNSWGSTSSLVHVSPAGRFYAGMDSRVYEYSEGADEMFGMMAAGVRPREIGEWHLKSVMG